MNKFMQAAIEEAYDGIDSGQGGPFGCVIVKDGKIVGRGRNRVILNHDATCHGEMEAIRDACRQLNTHDLSGCDLYTTAAPCPMCLGAIMWANIKNVFYGCSVEDSRALGFRDGDFYGAIFDRSVKHADEMPPHEPYNLPVFKQLDHDECMKLYSHFKKVLPDIFY